MEPSGKQVRRTWSAKFADAFRGIALGVRSEVSFAVHFAVAAAVIAAGVWLGVSAAEWSLLVLCISAVLAAEMFNSSVEQLAKAVDAKHNRLLGNALDLASGAVLVAALGSATVGLVIFLPKLLVSLSIA